MGKTVVSNSGDLAIVILAAGSSTRMRGQDKLLRQIRGEPLVTRVARRAIATGIPVYLCLPQQDIDRRSAIKGLDLEIVDVTDPERGMSVSLIAALDAAPPNLGGILLLLADMPDIEANDIDIFINHFHDDPHLIYRATDPSGKHGHPVVIPGDLLNELRLLKGDVGARAVLKAHGDRLCAVHLADDRALTDLDTPEDWATWEGAQPPKA